MKVCVIGLDGATWDLLDPWLDELPTIRGFAENFRADLGSCVPPLSIPAWKVYSTGMDPGQLGVFTFVDPDFEDQRFKTVTNETFVHKEIWDYLGASGMKSAVVNMPTTYPPRRIDGWMVSGPFSGNQKGYTWPPDMEEELERNGYTILPDYYLSRDPSDIDGVVASVHKKFDTALRLVSEVEFIHVTVFQTDTVQHTEWNSENSKKLWKRVDGEIERFVDRLGDEWNVVLMSDHGFGKTEGIFYLNPWLEERNYMNFDRSGYDLGDVAKLLGLDYATVKRLVRKLRLVEPIQTLVPSVVLRKIARQMPGNRKLEGLENRINWNSDAIALAPLIYTKNRTTAEEIRESLLMERDRSGNQIVDEVYYGEDIYPNSDVRVPDLIIKHGDYVISDVENDEIIAYDPDEWPEHKMAHHRMDGILAAMGPDVRRTEIASPKLYDLAPTMLDGFGTDIPSEMRGKSLGMLGSRGHRNEVETRLDKNRIVEHDRDVEERLKDLGYL